MSTSFLSGTHRTSWVRFREVSRCSDTQFIQNTRGLLKRTYCWLPERKSGFRLRESPPGCWPPARVHLGADLESVRLGADLESVRLGADLERESPPGCWPRECVHLGADFQRESTWVLTSRVSTWVLTSRESTWVLTSRESPPGSWPQERSPPGCWLPERSLSGCIHNTFLKTGQSTFTHTVMQCADMDREVFVRIKSSISFLIFLLCM